MNGSSPTHNFVKAFTNSDRALLFAERVARLARSSAGQIEHNEIYHARFLDPDRNTVPARKGDLFGFVRFQ